MFRPNVLRVLFLSVVVTLGLSTGSLFAGVHGGGGGGFHGGGGGFHGGGSSGAWHGGGYGGWHGGYYGGGRGGYYGGWHGGWGYPGYWGGWGFGISFNFAPYWGYYGYPYAYGYYPYYPYYQYYPYYPYYYVAPVSESPGYSNAAPYSQVGDNPLNSAPVERPGASVPQPAPHSNGLTLFEATYHQPPASPRTASAASSAASYRPPSAEREPPSMRPEVQNVIRALRGMPPDARQRQFDSGRYNSFSPQELQLVRYAANVP